MKKIFAHAKTLSDKYGMKIKVKHNKSRRFYFQINKSHLEKSNNSGKNSAKSQNSVLNSVLDTIDQMGVSPSGYLIPPEMIHVAENANYVIGTTFDLLLLNKKNQTVQEDCISLTQKFIEGKIEEIRPFIKDIYEVSEVIAFIDYLLSLTTVEREYDYSQPEITSNQIFVLRKARHPIMEQLISSEFAKKVSVLLPNSAPDSNAKDPSKFNNRNVVTFVPNDLDLTTAKPMIILKGVNMSGKTTFLQMAVQTLIMAQCGSFVPCEKCVMSPFTSVFTRSGTNDSIEGNASAFLVEMKEMNHIISLADSTSFIAIDEPCVSTSVRDGIGLSFACLEKLISAHSFVICSTHFCELESLLDIYPCVSLKEII
ncbi:MutS protein msh4 [Tritrichomonas musculus]|uniref:MutS protein msh4 n=1 Tax=Tritrichomonas musculus TaxID=1915356 RepID=A0ABR2I6I2_9EUKA